MLSSIQRNAEGSADLLWRSRELQLDQLEMRGHLIREVIYFVSLVLCTHMVVKLHSICCSVYIL